MHPLSGWNLSDWIRLDAVLNSFWRIFVLFILNPSVVILEFLFILLCFLHLVYRPARLRLDLQGKGLWCMQPLSGRNLSDWIRSEAVIISYFLWYPFFNVIYAVMLGMPQELLPLAHAASVRLEPIRLEQVWFSDYQRLCIVLIKLARRKRGPVVWLGRRGFNTRHSPDAVYLLCWWVQ